MAPIQDRGEELIIHGSHSPVWVARRWVDGSSTGIFYEEADKLLGDTMIVDTGTFRLFDINLHRSSVAEMRVRVGDVLNTNLVNLARLGLNETDTVLVLRVSPSSDDPHGIFDVLMVEDTAWTEYEGYYFGFTKRSQ
jgi:hypothetical protein